MECWSPHLSTHSATNWSHFVFAARDQPETGRVLLMNELAGVWKKFRELPEQFWGREGSGEMLRLPFATYDSVICRLERILIATVQDNIVRGSWYFGALLCLFIGSLYVVSKAEFVSFTSNSSHKLSLHWSLNKHHPKRWLPRCPCDHGPQQLKARATH